MSTNNIQFLDDLRKSLRYSINNGKLCVLIFMTK